MINSPENFHIANTKLYNFFNRLSLQKLQKFIDKRRIRINSSGQDEREFFVDWSSKKYNRISLVNKCLNKSSDIENTNYLEIGCAGNKLFQSVMAKTKIGVDPFSGGTHRMTSDTFFESNNSLYDVIFVDGLHEYQQAWRDVKNSLSSIEVGGYIGIHDMLPRNWIEAHIPCLYNGPWSGDVWKIAFDLLENDSVEFSLLNIDHGVGLVKKIKEDAASKLSANYGEKSYKFYADNRDKLPIIEFDELLF